MIDQKRRIALAAAALRREEERLRDNVNHGLMEEHLGKDQALFNRVCAVMDNVGDTTLALAHLPNSGGEEKGMAYLVTHGAFQSMEILVSACRLIGADLGVSYSKELDAEIDRIKDVRVRVTGHPYDFKSNKKTGRRAGTSGISRITLGISGFSLHEWTEDGKCMITGVSTFDYAVKSLRIARRCLRYVNEALSVRVKDLEREWVARPLYDHVAQLTYWCGKLNEAVRTGAAPVGILQTIEETLVQLRADKRVAGGNGEGLRYHLDFTDEAIRLLKCAWSDPQQPSADLQQERVNSRFLADQCNDIVSACQSLDRAFDPDAGLPVVLVAD
ncbi:MAG: hypothetical protein JSS66_17010 [Armatimonadetes bacterium]|nr:hypothetical protein [Armatimonadota bacterium]